MLPVYRELRKLYDSLFKFEQSQTLISGRHPVLETRMYYLSEHLFVILHTHICSYNIKSFFPKFLFVLLKTFLLFVVSIEYVWFELLRNEFESIVEFIQIIGTLLLRSSYTLVASLFIGVRYAWL